MKFIHTADLHIDSKIDYLPSSLSATRREEILRSFERLCEFAKQNQITAVIIAGDLFDCNKVTKKTIERVKNAIMNCDGVDFLYLQGNHDEVKNNEVFSSFPCNFKQFEEGLSTFIYDNVVISGIVNEGSYNHLCEQCNFDKNSFNILVMHGEVVDYKGKTKNGAISLPLLRGKNINYLALGHYHSFSVGDLDLTSKYAYSGCLDGRGFDELGQKGFILVDTEKTDFISFIPFSSREYVESAVDLTDYENWAVARSSILLNLKREIESQNVVKLIIEGEINKEFNLDIKEIEQTLRDYFFYAKVEDKTTLKLTQDDYLLDKSVNGEFMRLVWESELSDELKKKVISCGLNALRGEELI